MAWSLAKYNNIVEASLEWEIREHQEVISSKILEDIVVVEIVKNYLCHSGYGGKGM